jgi:hypothetical protein
LESYGLDRPLFRVQWLEVGSERMRTLELGGEPGPRGTIFARSSELPEEVLLVRGAALRMLAGLSGWKALRDARLLTFELDEVDEILIEAEGQKPAYFQRQGEFWADARDRRFRGEEQERIQRAFEAVEHLRIERFPDLELTLQRAAPTRRASVGPVAPGEVRLRMKDRKGREHRLSLLERVSGPVAVFSGRPKLTFDLHPQAKQWITALRTLPKKARTSP